MQALAAMLKRQLLSILIIFSSSPLFGQQVKKIVTTYPKSDHVKELYYVLKANKTIKHGDYFSFYKGELTKKELKNKDLTIETIGFKEKGKYQNNLKHGTWVTYKSPRLNNSISVYNSKLEEGQYTNDRKTGIWTTYLEDGKVVKQFDFDNNQEQPAQVKVRWKYPAQARKNRIEGPVRIKITYNNCEPIDYEIMADLGYGCGEAVIQSLKEKQLLEKKYGINSGKCDTTEETIDVQFRLDQ
jgi:hypothetical protein